MACELFAADNRTFAGMIIENFWSVAMCFLALLAYLVQNWVHLQLIISLFGLLTIPLYWCVVHTHKTLFQMHTQGLHLYAKFHLNVFIVSASGDQKSQFWAHFDI